jgi:hypothetical protein
MTNKSLELVYFFCLSMIEYLVDMSFLCPISACTIVFYDVQEVVEPYRLNTSEVANCLIPNF